MKVIICGAGQVGLGIAERLAAERNNISIIDMSAELVQRANDTLDVTAILGNAAHPDVLERAGAREADMLIAVTLQDEVNMVSCLVAQSVFDIPTKIARIRAPTYLASEWSKLFSRDSLSIDMVISPEIAVGDMILRRLETPGAFETVFFADNKAVLLGISCGPDCPVIDTPLTQLADLFPDISVAVVAIVRSGSLQVAHGDDQIRAGDDIYLVVDAAQASRTLQIFGTEGEQARRIIIAGGGNIGFYVAREIEKRSPVTRIKVIELSKQRATEIAERLDRSVILHGSALSEDLLREAEVTASDMLVGLTNNDQTNLLTSALAKQLGCKASLALINSANFSGMIRPLGIDAQLNPKAVTVSRILQLVRRGKIRAVHSLHNGAGEVLEAEVLETSGMIGKTIRELDLGDGVRFGAIYRKGKIIRPDGDTEFESRDRAVLFARADHVRDVEKLFRVSPDYFS
ncbi:MAG: Trk system potassium transporter TrkA [Hyphomicrobium sp.]|nr:Trk system potassium transporter TrkA [Hyphomicrobium sp.]